MKSTEWTRAECSLRRFRSAMGTDLRRTSADLDSESWIRLMEKATDLVFVDYPMAAVGGGGG